jgi:hypothetical protein
LWKRLKRKKEELLFSKSIMEHLDASGGSLLADILPMCDLASRENVVFIRGQPPQVVGGVYFFAQA